MAEEQQQAVESNSLALIQIAASCILAGGLTGATTNAINGVVSAEYFRKIMNWRGVENVWRAAIAQGIFEGLIYGVLFAVVFTLVVGRVSHSRCSFRFAGRHLTKIVLGVYCCWAVGGFVAIGLALLSPEFYRQTFSSAPSYLLDLLRFAWVGGSIWGAMFGGLLAVVIGSLHFTADWKRHHAVEE